MGNCAICVDADQLKSVEYFGEFLDIKQPGVHFLGFDVLGICYSTRSVSTRIIENRIRCETKTTDDVFVYVDVAVQVEVITKKAKEAIYKLDDPAKQIESFVSNVIRAKVPKLKLDDVFLSKDQLAQAVKSELVYNMEEFGYCIHSVLVTDIDPDQNVKNAMNEINVARRLRIAAADKAEAEKIMQVKAAEADAESKFLQGQGIARQRAAIVSGLKESLCGEDGKSMDAEKVRELLLITQYFDTLEKMSSGNATTIFMPHTVGGMNEVAEQMQKGILAGNAAANPKYYDAAESK